MKNGNVGVYREVTVREYARLTTTEVKPNLDQAQISPSAFRWISQYSEKLRASGAEALVRIEGPKWLRLDNYVGVVESPCGTRLEILPKHFDKEDNVDRTRDLLTRMLQQSLNLPTKEVGPATLRTFRKPVGEWLIGQFLLALDQLVKSGLRFIYHRVEEERRFLRGRLAVAR